MSERSVSLGLVVSLSVCLACTGGNGDDEGADGTEGSGTSASTSSSSPTEGSGPSSSGVDGTGTSDSGGSEESSGGASVDPPQSWDTILVKEVRSAAYVGVDDLDQDGTLDIVLSTLMEVGDPSPFPPAPAGAVRLFLGTGDLQQWDEQLLVSTDAGLGFINEPQLLDINGDGVRDIVLNTGFLTFSPGSHQYLPGPGFAGPVPFTAETAGPSSWFWHGVAQSDLDGDGDLDVVTTRTHYEGGFLMPTTWELAVDWYRNDGGGSFTAFEIDTGHCGTVIRTYDVDDDGDDDLVCSQFFGPPAEPSIVWIEQLDAPTGGNGWLGQWELHSIDSTTGFGFDVHFVDIDDDGSDELVYSNHNNQNNPDLGGIPSGLYAFEIPADPASSSAWDKQVIDEGYMVTAPDMGDPGSQGSPALIGLGDIDGNGLLDLVTAGDGADGLFVIWQTAVGQFERRMIADGPMFGQPVVVDLDGDGQLEVVAAQHKYPEGLVLPEGNLSIYAPVFE